MPEKNQDLPGVEGEGVSRKKVKAVEIAADNYCDIRDKRMAMTEKEVDAKAVLIDKMKQHGLTVYVYDDHRVEILPGKEKIKVRTVDGDDAGGDEDDD